MSIYPQHHVCGNPTQMLASARKPNMPFKHGNTPQCHVKVLWFSTQRLQQENLKSGKNKIKNFYKNF